MTYYCTCGELGHNSIASTSVGNPLALKLSKATPFVGIMHQHQRQPTRSFKNVVKQMCKQADGLKHIKDKILCTRQLTIILQSFKLVFFKSIFYTVSKAGHKLLICRKIAVWSIELNAKCDILYMFSVARRFGA